VHFDILPALSNIESAMEKDAVLIYPPGQEDGVSSASEGGTPPASWQGNIRGPSRLDFFCEPKKAVEVLQRKSQEVIAFESSAHAQLHNALEPHCCVAHWLKDDRVEVWCSTQIFTNVRQEIADNWDLNLHDVLLHVEHVGGGFGAKSKPQLDLKIAIDLYPSAYLYY